MSSTVPTGTPLRLHAIGSRQFQWRPFLNTEAQCTNAAALSGAGTYLNLTAYPSTSTDFSTDPKIVTPIVEPSAIMAARFYAQAAAGVLTATARVWGLRETRGQRLAGVDFPNIECGEEFSGDMLFDMAFRVGGTQTGASSRLRPYAAGAWRWVDLISVTNDRTLPPNVRLSSDAAIGPADGASIAWWDTSGYAAFIFELRIGAGVTALGGEYTFL